DAYARRECALLRLGISELKHTGHVCGRVERLRTGAERLRRVLVPDPEIQAQVGTNTPRILREGITRRLVAVVSRCPERSLPEYVRSDVAQIEIERRILVIPAQPLRERLRSDIPVHIFAELESMTPSYPSDIVRRLVCVLRL